MFVDVDVVIVDVVVDVVVVVVFVVVSSWSLTSSL